MAAHSSTLAWKIPWTEEPGGLQSMGSLRIGHDWLSDFTFTFHFHALEKGMATHSSVLAWRIPGTGELGGLPSMGSQSRTRLKWLSSSRSSSKANRSDYQEIWQVCYRHLCCFRSTFSMSSSNNLVTLPSPLAPCTQKTLTNKSTIIILIRAVFSN